MLPAAASFKKQGANRGAIASFLVSTPESGIDSIAITYALMDPIMTVVRPIAAFCTGIAAGTLENILSYDREKKESADSVVSLESGTKIHKHMNNDGSAGFKTKLISGTRYAFIDVWGDIVFWFFAGLLLAGIITVYLPDRFSEMVLGGGFVSMLAMLLVGMPVYICATASTPVAAALLLKGASPGAVLVFLLVGPATNMTSLSVLVKILGKRGTLRYLLTIAVSAILFGLLVDSIYQYFGIEPKVIIQEAREVVPYSVKLFFGVALLLLSIYHLFLRFQYRREKKKEAHFIAGFPAMRPAVQHCHCKHDNCGCK